MLGESAMVWEGEEQGDGRGRCGVEMCTCVDALLTASMDGWRL